MNFRKTYKKQLLPAVISLCVLPLSAGSANAQESSVGLEEIIVTAQKRQASLQETPIAVSALSPGQLERGSIQTVLDVAKHVPNVEFHTVSQSGASLGASIRGIGFDDLEKAFEPTVGVSIDGVFMASNSGAVVDFFDIAAVEVLRGPQGTLYGRNTIAGVINIKRTEPTGEFGAKLQATSASHNRKDVKGILNMPLGENGGVKLNFRNLTSDSHLYNQTNQERPKNRDSDVFGIAVKYDFSEQTSAVVSYDSYDHKTQPFDPISISEDSGGSLCARIPAVFGGNCKARSGDLSEAGGYKDSYAKNQILGYIEGDNWTINAEHQGDDFILKYIMGSMEFEELSDLDSWGSDTPFVKVVRNQMYEQVSHEFQYISDYDGAFNFVAGLYHLDTESFLTSGPGQAFTSAQDANAKAVFGEMTYDLSDLWTLTAGVRYTEEEKELTMLRWASEAGGAATPRLDNGIRQFGDINEATVNLNDTFEDDNLSYRLIVQRNFDIGMAFASYSTGYRSGGFNPRASTAFDAGPYQSEEVTNLEFGIRTQPTDTLQINATVFSSDYTDKQQFVAVGGEGCNPTCTLVRNAAETSNQGLEIEAVVLPTDALTVRFSYGYLDSEVEEYLVLGEDISDNAWVPYAPENTASLTVEHASQTFGGDLVINGSLSYRSDLKGVTDASVYDPAIGPDMNIESHDQLDLSATFKKEAGDGVFKAQLYVTDVLESDGRVSRKYDAGAFAWAELVPGREVGLTVGYEF